MPGIVVHSLIPAFKRQEQRQRQRQMGFYEFKGSLVYIASSKTAKLS